MYSRSDIDDGHVCRGCWTLAEGVLADDLEEIIAHEDPGGRFISITDAHGAVERYPIESPMTRLYLEARGLEWR